MIRKLTPTTLHHDGPQTEMTTSDSDCQRLLFAFSEIFEMRDSSQQWAADRIIYLKDAQRPDYKP